ncbi:MAG: HAD-IC family P-type ATPase [Actinomycetota bacterium]
MKEPDPRDARMTLSHGTDEKPLEPTAARARQGLTDAEVAARVAEGHVNVSATRSSRSALDIVRANVFTRFNALLGALSVLALLIGPPQDALFGLVVIANSLIGIIQELRAKRVLDRFRVLSSPTARVIRDGLVREISIQEVVLDDVLEIGAGDQIVVDGEVLQARGLEIDESLLTGESDPVAKEESDRLLSGSFVVAGSGRFVATAVGRNSYAAGLASAAQEFSLVTSEIQGGINNILRWVTWALVPTAILLFASQMSQGTESAISGAIAGVVALVPEGLVLLTSITFAVGVVRLASFRVLVQQLPAIEVLARIDVICLDKTGTITEGARGLTLSEVEALTPNARPALGALAASDPRPNATVHAIAAAVDAPEGWIAGTSVPFSSARRWSGADFGSHGRWVLGAPEVILAGSDGELAARVGAHADQGRRVVLLAHVRGSLDAEGLDPGGLEPAALVVLEDKVREEAPDTVRYFKEQGVDVKVFSGDHPKTVGAVVARAGVTPGPGAVDASRLPEDDAELGRLLADANVFGRVAPEQKLRLVDALKNNGRVVAMVGDGVNDVPALKSADIGVALGSGTQAARAVAELVLLNDSFAGLPHVVREGRRAMANVERVANLFVTKTVYAMLLALAIGVAGMAFPFLPRHLTLIGAVTIGIPSFFLALAPGAPRARPGFVKRVLRFAVPAGTWAAIATFSAYALARLEPDVSLVEARTTATLALVTVGIALLIRLSQPLTRPRRLLVAAMIAGVTAALVVPPLSEFFALNVPPAIVVLAATGAAAIAMWGLELVAFISHNFPQQFAREDESTAESLAAEIRQGEDERTAFVARTGTIGDDGIEMTTATIAALANTEGGMVYVGVDAGGTIVGLGGDVHTVPEDREVVERGLRNSVVERLGAEFAGYMDVRFPEVNGIRICTVEVKTAKQPAYVKDGESSILFVREGRETKALPVDEAIGYVAGRWPTSHRPGILDILLGRGRSGS